MIMANPVQHFQFYWGRSLQAAVTIQRHLRGFLVRIAIRRHRAAVVIQVFRECRRYEDDDLRRV